MTIIIAVLNQKGGAGKTTIASNLGESFKRQGCSVLLVDTDPQGSLRDWNEASEGACLPVVGLDRPTLATDIKAVTKDYDIVIIDGAPKSNKLAGSAIRCADLILIPVPPSPYDVWATASIVEIIQERQIITDGKPKAFFIISRAMKGTRLGDEVEEALGSYEFPVLSSRTINRQDYPRSASDGLTVFHTKNKDAINEINQLRIEIEGIINNGL